MHRGTVESFTYWKHDERPAGDEPILKAMNWAHLASVLHADHSGEASTASPPQEAPPSSSEI